jgi:hypothetical protein
MERDVQLLQQSRLRLDLNSILTAPSFAQIMKEGR